MSFDPPTLDEQHEILVALYHNLFRKDAVDVSQGSFNWLWSRTQAGGVTDNHAHLASLRNDLLPDTAPDDGMLDRHGTTYGVIRKLATPARKDKALRVVGNVAAPVPDLSVLVHASGLQFEINGAAVVGAGGFVDCNVVAIDVGSATRLNAGEQLNFVATPAGLQETAELQLALDEDGTDRETADAYRSRILSRLSTPPLGGAQNDYVQWALEETGIAAAFAYPLRQGKGSVDMVGLHAGTGQSRVLLAGEVTALQAAVAAKKPVAVTFRVLTVTTRAIDVEYVVLPDGDATSEFDWSDAVAPLVLAWQPGGVQNKLQFQGGTRPPDMVPGQRIAIKPVAGGGTGQQYVIEALSGADAIILESTPNPAPANNDVVYAGGPLVDAIRAAIQALIDSLGTANPDANRYGAWEGNLRPGSIDRAARGIAGVLDGTVAAPGALVQASDPATDPVTNGTIELLIAGRILVRRAR